MKKVVALAALTALGAAAAHAYLGEVLASWQAPGTYLEINGIAFEGEYIWLKDKLSHSERKRVLKCTKAGSMMTSIAFPYPPPVFYSRGLTFDGKYLWTVYEYWHIPYYDSYRKYTTTGSNAGGFWLHVNYGPESEAVAWDGQYLWTDEKRKGSETLAGKYTTTGTVEVVGEEGPGGEVRTINIVNGTFTDDFDPETVHIYKFQKPSPYVPD